MKYRSQFLHFLTCLSSSSIFSNLRKSISSSDLHLYDYAERVVKAYNAQNNSVITSYDALGNPVLSTDYAGTATTSAFDALGRLVSETSPIETGFNAVKEYTYYPDCSVFDEKTATNAAGSPTTWSFIKHVNNWRGDPMHIIQYDNYVGAGTTRYEYYEDGSVKSVREGASSPTSTDGHVTAYQTEDRDGCRNTQSHVRV